MSNLSIFSWVPTIGQLRVYGSCETKPTYNQAAPHCNICSNLYHNYPIFISLHSFCLNVKSSDIMWITKEVESPKQKNKMNNGYHPIYGLEKA